MSHAEWLCSACTTCRYPMRMIRPDKGGYWVREECEAHGILGLWLRVGS